MKSTICNIALYEEGHDGGKPELLHISRMEKLPGDILNSHQYIRPTVSSKRRLAQAIANVIIAEPLFRIYIRDGDPKIIVTK
jgi:hypothetical protein